jgi:hypothetical protein
MDMEAMTTTTTMEEEVEAEAWWGVWIDGW